jgi:CheY-like chemotaxis protein
MTRQTAGFDREAATGEHALVRPLRVLVVEDDPDILDALTCALGGDSYEVIGVDDGVEAMLLLGARRFDLILLDLYLPGMDGEAILEALRAKDVRTPVVLASASMAIGATARAFGVAGFLPKPFSLPALEAMVARVVAQPLSHAGAKTDS